MSGYTDTRPEDSGVIETFTFSTKLIPDTKANIDLQLEALNARLENLVDKCKVDYQDGRYPILAKILDVSRDRTELERLSKGLQIVASFIEEFDVLRERQNVLAMAQKDPGWFAAAFGDFDKDINHFLDVITQDDETLTSEE